MVQKVRGRGNELKSTKKKERSTNYRVLKEAGSCESENDLSSSLVLT